MSSCGARSTKFDFAFLLLVAALETLPSQNKYKYSSPPSPSHTHFGRWDLSTPHPKSISISFRNRQDVHNQP